jgi:hypothetical protein
VFTSDSEGNDSNSYASASRTKEGLNYLLEEKNERLKEKLLKIPYDRAYEEEKIMNTVFPPTEIRNL